MTRTCATRSTSSLYNWAAGCGDEIEISLPEIFANLEAATAEVPKVIGALLTA